MACHDGFLPRARRDAALADSAIGLRRLDHDL